MLDRPTQKIDILRRCAATLLIAAALSASLVSGASARALNNPPANDPQSVIGIWLNPHGSVAVRTGLCNGRLCGWIVWASHEALDDARDSGVASLIGTELLEDYARQDSRRWSGTVYVPDMGHRFSSTITQSSANILEVKGCLIGGFLCKAQNWRRIEALPGA